MSNPRIGIILKRKPENLFSSVFLGQKVKECHLVDGVLLLLLPLPPRPLIARGSAAAAALLPPRLHPPRILLGRRTPRERAPSCAAETAEAEEERRRSMFWISVTASTKSTLERSSPASERSKRRG